MPARNDLIVELIKEVLGPRSGLNEALPANSDPRDEFITGVLSPVGGSTGRQDIEAEVSEIVEEGFAEDDEINVDVALPPLISPSLDPRSLPHSIGISFT